MTDKNQQIPEHITASFLKYIGLRNEAIADLKVYLSRPVGVGEHGDISGEIDKKLAEIEKYDSISATIQKLFPDVQEKIFGTEDSKKSPQIVRENAKPTMPKTTGSAISGNSDQVFTPPSKDDENISQEDIENSEG